MKRNPARTLALAAGLVIVALTAAAFWLSYAHLAEVARRHGLNGAPVRAWAWPATLDLFIVAGELLMLRAALARKVDVWAIGLVVVGSGGSIALNVAGVGSHADPLNYVVAAVPPTAALLAFGALMKQIHQALTEHTEPVEVTTEQPRPQYRWDNLGGRLVDTAPWHKLDVFKEQWAPADPAETTTAVPAVQAREVVTEVITLSPAELRRKARSLNREAVRATRRPVTIKTLQDELGLSRRDATELRREVVGERS
jgi:hypothetical protein